MKLPVNNAKYACPVICMLLLFPMSVHAELVDTIISADFVVTMDSNRTVINDGAVAVREGAIIAVGARKKIITVYQARERLHGVNRVLMPGLINGHTHAAMTLFRGLADDLPLMDWLEKFIFPAEIRYVDEEFVRVGTRLACLEMIRGGTTAFTDMYFHPVEIAGVVDECGVRAVIGAAVIEQESGYTKDFPDAMQKAEYFIRQWKGANSRITPAFAPHAAYTITPENLQYVRERAQALGVPVAIHISEGRAEVKMVSERYGNTPVQHLEGLGFFNGPTIGAHVVHPTADEIPVLAQRRVGAIHCPTSNLKVAAGVAPVPEMLAAGVPVGLGTDGAASNNDLDMWEEIRLAALLHKDRLADPAVMPAADVLHIATRGGAEAIGLGEHTGSLEPGKRADMIQVSLEGPHLVPLYDVVSHLVYAADAQDVETVMVDGRVLMRDRRLLTLDELSVIKSAKKIADQINAGLRE